MYIINCHTFTVSVFRNKKLNCFICLYFHLQLSPPPKKKPQQNIKYKTPTMLTIYDSIKKNKKIGIE